MVEFLICILCVKGGGGQIMPTTLLLSPKFSDLPSALVSYLLNKTCFRIENNKHTEVLQSGPGQLSIYYWIPSHQLYLWK